MAKTNHHAVDGRIEELHKAFMEAGIRLTHQRLEIFREIAASAEHPDVETVYRAVRVRMPTVSRDTVYRTLWMLRDLGLITTLGPQRRNVRFDANLEHHHHYVCVRCGLARDFRNEEFNALRIPETVTRLGSVVGTQVEVRGICERCQKKGKADAAPGRRAEPRRGDRRKG
jgi:Fur family transcriptional regulator, peroxide stress response regulator